MSDYISKSAFIEDIKTEIVNLSMNGLKGTPRPREELYQLIERIEEQPTLDETEIISKYGEKILDAFYGKHAEYRRLSEQANIELPQECYYSGHTKGFEEAIKIVKEECGISE